jgi:hypothetical protein
MNKCILCEETEVKYQISPTCKQCEQWFKEYNDEVKKGKK